MTLDGLRWLFVEQSAWWASVISLVMMWLMGNKVWWGPGVGLLGQVFWLILALHTGQYGLLLATAFYSVVHVRNLVKWRAERRPRLVEEHEDAFVPITPLDPYRNRRGS